MAVDAGTIFSSVRIRLDKLDEDLKGVYARLNQLEGSAKKNQKSFGDFFKSINVLGVSAVAGLAVAFKKASDFMQGSVDVSIAAQETYSKFGVVFGDIKGSAEAAAKSFADSFDLASVTAKQLLGDTGNILTGFGATQQQALELSVQMNTLAADLASFTNVQGGTATASHALMSAMLGEREQAKQLGIVIREVDVQQRLAEKGQQGLTGEAKNLATAQATLELATEQAKNAMGDYARTSESAANINKRAEESTKKLQVALGTGLAPVATITAKLFGTIAEKLAEIIEQSNTYRDAVAAEKEGNATIEQRILLLGREIEKQREILRQGQETVAFYEDTAAGKAIQERIDGLVREKAALADSLRYQGKAGEEAEKAAIAAARRAQDEKARNDALKADLELVAEHYENTEEGKRAALEKELAVWQKYKETAEKTGPKVEAIIAEITDKLRKMNEVDSLTLALAQARRDARKAEAQERAAADRDLLATTEEYQQKLEERGKSEQDLIQIERERRLATIEAADADIVYTDMAREAVNEYYDAIADEAAWNSFKANATAAMTSAQQLFSALSQYIITLAKQQADSRIAELDRELQQELYNKGLAEAATVEQYEAELQAAIAAGDEERIAEAKSNLEKAKIEEEYAKKKAEVQYKYELLSWKLKLLAGTANAAQAVVGALSAPPFWPINAPFVAAATAAGALQVAAINAAKPVKQKFEYGGIVPGSSYTGDRVTVGVNSGEMILNAEQQARLFGLASGSGGGGGAGLPARIVVQLNDRVLADAVVTLVNDRQYLISSGSIKR